MADLQPADLAFIAKFLRERSGLVVTADKGYLLDSRLGPLARRHGCKDVSDLIGRLRAGGDDTLARLVVEAMTTNESFFFRDQKPFDHFKAISLPHLLRERAGKRSIRIWCAAASSGQEPYSLAIMLKEQAEALRGWKIEIVATDLDREILDRAKAGMYSQFEVQRGLPIQLLVKYFKKQDQLWQIDASLRAMVQFREFNLLNDPRPLGQFDMVYCRNVLIYFDPPTKGRVLDGIAGLMPHDGFLYLGGAETVLGVSNRFAAIPNERGVYRRTPA